MRLILPEHLVLIDPQSLTFYGKDWLKDFTPAPSLVVLPETVDQVQAVVRLCNQHNVAIVPSGGRTGLSGGATATQGEIILSLERMRKIIEINRVERTIRCQAGVALEQVQAAAVTEGLYFPVDFSSRGTAQIGGNIATNAGGIRVIKYGNFRQSVLGLTVITGGGRPARTQWKSLQKQHRVRSSKSIYRIRRHSRHYRGGDPDAHHAAEGLCASAVRASESRLGTSSSHLLSR